MIKNIYKAHEKGKEPSLETYLRYIVRGSETWNEIEEMIEAQEPQDEEEAKRLDYLRKMMK